MTAATLAIVIPGRVTRMVTGFYADAVVEVDQQLDMEMQPLADRYGRAWAIVEIGNVAHVVRSACRKEA